MNMHDRSTRFRRAKTGVGDLLGRDRQMRRHVRRRLVAGHRTGDDDFVARHVHFVSSLSVFVSAKALQIYKARPPSTTIVAPVE